MSLLLVVFSFPGSLLVCAVRTEVAWVESVGWENTVAVHRTHRHRVGCSSFRKMKEVLRKIAIMEGQLLVLAGCVVLMAPLLLLLLLLLLRCPGGIHRDMGGAIGAAPGRTPPLDSDDEQSAAAATATGASVGAGAAVDGSPAPGDKRKGESAQASGTPSKKQKKKLKYASCCSLVCRRTLVTLHRPSSPTAHVTVRRLAARCFRSLVPGLTRPCPGRWPCRVPTAGRN